MDKDLSYKICMAIIDTLISEDLNTISKDDAGKFISAALDGFMKFTDAILTLGGVENVDAIIAEMLRGVAESLEGGEE